jgi:hypothetical protein
LEYEAGKKELPKAAPELAQTPQKQLSEKQEIAQRRLRLGSEKTLAERRCGSEPERVNG